MAAWIKMPLGMEVGLGPGDFVLDGTPLPSTKRGRAPKFFSADVYCGQTTGWIKMALGAEVRLRQGDFVLYGDADQPSQRRGRSLPPQFSAHFCYG